MRHRATVDRSMKHTGPLDVGDKAAGPSQEAIVFLATNIYADITHGIALLDAIRFLICCVSPRGRKAAAA